MNILFLISLLVFACLLGYFYFILFLMITYLVLENQGTEQIMLDIWKKNLKICSKNSTFKFDKCCKLGFVSCSH